MKTVFLIIVTILSFSTLGSAQDASKEMKTNVISFTQVPGEFTQKSKTIAAGTYVFEITNQDAGTDVGFVLVKKGLDVTNPDNHIKTAYVTQVVKEGKTEKSQATELAKGTYVYFCPLNKTRTDNTLIVQ